MFDLCLCRWLRNKGNKLQPKPRRQERWVFLASLFAVQIVPGVYYHYEYTYFVIVLYYIVIVVLFVSTSNPHTLVKEHM